MDWLNLEWWKQRWQKLDWLRERTHQGRFLRHMALGGVRCQVQEGAVILRYPSDAAGEGITLNLFFDPEDGPYVSVRCYCFGPVPEEETPRILRVCNRMNREQGWAKFFLDEENDVVAAADEIVDERTVGPEVEELCAHLVMSIEEALPAFRRLEE